MGTSWKEFARACEVREGDIDNLEVLKNRGLTSMQDVIIFSMMAINIPYVTLDALKLELSQVFRNIGRMDMFDSIRYIHFQFPSQVMY